MSIEANKALLRRYFEEVFLGRNYDTDLVDQATFGDLRTRLAGAHAAFPDYRMTIDEIVAEGDLVALRWTNEGTHAAPFLGIPATGKRVSWVTTAIYRVKDGRIVDHVATQDRLGLLQQLGATITPPSEPSSPSEVRKR